MRSYIHLIRHPSYLQSSGRHVQLSPKSEADKYVTSNGRNTKASHVRVQLSQNRAAHDAHGPKPIALKSYASLEPRSPALSRTCTPCLIPLEAARTRVRVVNVPPRLGRAVLRVRAVRARALFVQRQREAAAAVLGAVARAAHNAVAQDAGLGQSCRVDRVATEASAWCCG